jgi:uncharacterized lipoprotein NlpE involved in copper resistance
MANKKIWLGMLVIVLVLGMTVVGCDNAQQLETETRDGNDPNNGNEKISIVGTWVYAQGTGLQTILRFNSDLSVVYTSSVTWRGTYSISGSTVIITYNSASTVGELINNTTLRWGVECFINNDDKKMSNI